ncbi:MAG: P-II family nitrogen regulator [Clostridiales bacterium]|jgi:nitrogen regulatory protein PII|nr:P-II family nitrogen regulator [Clostridiales bacterium]
MNSDYKIIFTIVKKGMGSMIVSESKKLGASASTIMLGKGTAPKSIYTELLGMSYEPEKEIIMTLVKEDLVEKIMQRITDLAKLNQRGNGISFVINLKK